MGTVRASRTQRYKKKENKSQDKTGDILFKPPEHKNLCIGYLSIINSTARSYCDDVLKRAGATAAIRDKQEEAA